jgi:hypothetical protein
VHATSNAFALPSGARPGAKADALGIAAQAFGAP